MFSEFPEHVCLVSLRVRSWPSCSFVFGTGHAHLYPVVCFATPATRRSVCRLCGTLFDGFCVKSPTSSTTMSTVTLLWLTIVPLILRRPPIMCCDVVGCIMPRFACCLWPTITLCMNVRFGFDALQLLFCSIFLKSQVRLRQTVHYWVNAGVLLGAHVRRRVSFETINYRDEVNEIKKNRSCIH